jgi:hypothetical protein
VESASVTGRKKGKRNKKKVKKKEERGKIKGEFYLKG